MPSGKISVPLLHEPDRSAANTLIGELRRNFPSLNGICSVEGVDENNKSIYYTGRQTIRTGR